MTTDENPELGDGAATADEVAAIIAKALDEAHGRVTEAVYHEENGEATLVAWLPSGQQFRVEIHELF